MTRKQTRFTIIIASLAVVAFAVGLILYAIRDTIVFFYTPSDVVAKAVKPGTRIRLGGMVETGSWTKGANGLNEFVITDTIATTRVTYKGVVPDLFREGQGVVTEGVMDQTGGFTADTVLAKHDENYMPKEISDSLKAKGIKLGSSSK